MIDWELFGPAVRWGNAMVFMAEFSSHMKTLGYGVGLTGSVITCGRSKKDLDVVVYPMNSNVTVSNEAMRAHLEAFGLVKLYDLETVQKRWRKLGSSDNKHVEVWANAERQRIDLFFLS